MQRFIKRSQLAVEQLDDRICLSTAPMAPVVLNEALVDHDQPKPQAALDHGVTVLAWARVDGVSPLSQSRTSDRTSDYSAIAFVGGWGSSMYQYAYNDPISYSQQPLRLLSDEASDYSAIAFVGGWGSSMYQYAYNDPYSYSQQFQRTHDDVIVDGRIITGENYDSADVAFQGYIKIKKLNTGG